MKNLKKLIALVLCAALLLPLVGCKQEPMETTAPPTEPPTTAPTEPPAEDVYAEARAELDSAGDISLELLITKYTTVIGDEFSEQSTQTLTYQDVGTDEEIILMEESIMFSIHEEVEPDEDDEKDEEDEEDEPVEYKEIWYQGNVYAELDETYRYSGAVDAEAAAARYTPVVLLDADLYGSVTSENTAAGKVITFAEPVAAESWAMPEEAELVEASGTATVSDQGAMEEMTYTITYIYGNSEITLEVQSKPKDTPDTITAPENTEDYPVIGYVDALRLSLTAPVMLMQADNITASSLESMVSQAAGLIRNQSAQVNVSGRREETEAKVELGLFVRTSNNKTQELDQEETYSKGKLTTVVNDGLPTVENFDWEDMRDYTVDMMLQGIPAIDYWQDVTATDMGTVTLLEFTLNENFGNSVQNGICKMLWNDPSFLYNLASKYESAELTAYLSVDKFNGLPVAAGYYYKGIHTIDGRDYELTLQVDQSMEAPSKGAYKEITDEMPVEEEPENKATPLFYHVTGEDGQEMWLLGTIHVGDERTAYLPQEIYDAFTASDVLAIECNNDAFEEQLEEDDKLSKKVSDMYYYSGKTTIEKLMEEEEYAQAVKLMKATGSYNMNMPYAKPYLWESTIGDFYLRQGYQLHRDQGVEERLMAWAEEQEKEIREIESSLAQIKMLTGFSNDLQLMMLRDVMEIGAQEYWEDTMDLYEKWCAGDEAVLREELSDEVDMTDWTEEEIAEYESVKKLIDEYNKGMSYDRNKGMLKTAIKYLESDEVVFYAVGLAHLLNDVNGLVDALREAGYTVELVTYAG